MTKLNLKVTAKNDEERDQLLKDLSVDSCAKSIRISPKNPNSIIVHINGMSNRGNNYSQQEDLPLITYKISEFIKKLLISGKAIVKINSGESTFLNESNKNVEVTIVCSVSGGKLFPYYILPDKKIERFCTIAYFSTGKDLATVFLSYKKDTLFTTIERKYMFFNYSENEIGIKREILWRGIDSEPPKRYSHFNAAFSAGMEKIEDDKNKESVFRYGLEE